MSDYNGFMGKKIVILCETIAEGEELQRLHFSNSDLTVKITTNDKIVLNYLSKERGDIYALVLFLNELELQTINDLGRNLYLSAQNPDLNFVAVIRTMKKLDFEVFFYNFPLITVDFAEVHTLPDRLNALKQVA